MQKPKRRRFAGLRGSRVLFAVLVVLMLAVPAAKLAAQSPLYGMNYSFYDVDTTRLADCRRDRGATFHGKEFLSRYDQPAVRNRVVSQLSAMRRAGFREVRTIVFFAQSGKQPADWFDFDRDLAKAATAVRRYAEDLAKAGFSELELAFGPMGPLKPACRPAVLGAQWGDCFRPDTVPNQIRFMTAVRQGLGNPPLPVRIDISNETCPTPRLPRRLAANFEAYLVSVLRGYPRAFARDRLTASCDLERFAEARASIDRVFAAANRTPDFYELHAYHQPNRPYAAALAQARRILASAPQPVTLGEVTYGDRAYLAQLLQSLPRVRSVDFWPLARWASKCGMDTAPPYTVKAAVGLH